MLLSRPRHNEHIQIRRWLRRPRISSVSSQLCQMWRTQVTGGGGHRRPVWMAADWRDYLLYDSHFGFLPPPTSSRLPCFSLAPVLTGFLISYVFSTGMPHYILKVNPINTEITLEDKLLRRGSFCMCVCVCVCVGGLITIAWSPPCFILHRQCLPPEILTATSYILTRLALYLL